MKRYIIVFVVMLFLLSINAAPCWAPSYESPEEQRTFEKTYDKKNILTKASMQTDTSGEFITIPSDYPEVIDFEVAERPPIIDFAIVQGLDPWYLPSFDRSKGGIYGGWGDVTKGPDGCFYFSIGNHMSYGGTAYIIRYNPATKTQSIVVDLMKVVGYSKDIFGDGKFHGDPDIGPGGDMWLLSFFGPVPTREDIATSYNGSWLIRYNIFSGAVENYGIPLEGESWPYHSYDWQRGIIFGVGAIKGCVIAYDTISRKMIYGASPPKNIHWYIRGVMLDRETGKVYTTNSKTNNDEHHTFAYWERRNNTFTLMNAETPPNPVHGKRGPLRAHTKRKDADGAFWCFDFHGTFFKFFPNEDRVEPIGVNWGGIGEIHC